MIVVYFRSLVAKGQAADKLGGNAPKAANMYKMKYDCEIEKIAARHAAKCVFAHSTNAERENNGENLYMRMPPTDDVTKMAGNAADAWFAELEKYGVGQENVFTMALANRQGMMIGHYTQVSSYNFIKGHILKMLKLHSF
ncbi:unnamed protein product [Strongylus vulgaris]|uniref:SCP domain-containing protein n=1 Tax=Strongylus vulgaris TaxID=40348 RepID=A0A3P7JE05_STRVU|nr:unnamed protein product [Strongylus vulgaris]